MPLLVIAVLFWLIAILTAMEMATFSARKERMVQVAEAGDRRGLIVNAFQRSPSYYISAIQLIATAANFVIGALIGVNIETPIGEEVDRLLPTFGYRQQLSWIVSVGFMTVIALIFTNVLPKHIGFVRANEIAIRTAPMMRIWIKVSWPVVSGIQRICAFLIRLLKVAPDKKHRVTEQDIGTLLAEGVRAGSIDQMEGRVMQSVMLLSNTLVGDVMKPRDRVLWVDPSWSEQELDTFFREHKRSNYPVARGSLDEVIGTIRTQDWFIARNIESSSDPAVFASPTVTLVEAIELLRPADTRLLIVREAGRVVGILTLNDVLSHIVGPIRES